MTYKLRIGVALLAGVLLPGFALAQGDGKGGSCKGLPS
jgi:hypothetical protein